MKIYTKNDIEKAINIPRLIHELEQGFLLASYGKALVIPKASSMQFPNAEVHIKSGALADGDFYVVKIASGFYDNPKLGLPSSNGAMLLFSQKTGELVALLHDEGFLTNIRTALTGAIAAKYLAPAITKIGIIGTGTQAKEQLMHLQQVTSCREVLVWGRDFAKAEKLNVNPFNICAVKTIEEITDNCNLIITTTPSTTPLLFGHQIRPGTHITAVGADDLGKQELDSSVFDVADLIVVDSLSQCSQFGDLAHAKNIELNSVIELGNWIESPRQREPQWITVADLTGTAIADLQVAKSIFELTCE
jgi:ornithine cyclodeaminase